MTNSILDSNSMLWVGFLSKREGGGDNHDHPHREVYKIPGPPVGVVDGHPLTSCRGKKNGHSKSMVRPIVLQVTCTLNRSPMPPLRSPEPENPGDRSTGRFGRFGTRSGKLDTPLARGTQLQRVPDTGPEEPSMTKMTFVHWVAFFHSKSPEHPQRKPSCIHWVASFDSFKESGASSIMLAHSVATRLLPAQSQSASVGLFSHTPAVSGIVQTMANQFIPKLQKNAMVILILQPSAFGVFIFAIPPPSAPPDDDHWVSNPPSVSTSPPEATPGPIGTQQCAIGSFPPHGAV